MARQRLECGDLSPRFPGGSARPRFMRWRTANAGARSKPSTLNLQLSTAVSPGCAALRDFPATDRRALPAALQLFPQTEGLPSPIGFSPTQNQHAPPIGNPAFFCFSEHEPEKERKRESMIPVSDTEPKQPPRRGGGRYANK